MALAATGFASNSTKIIEEKVDKKYKI